MINKVKADDIKGKRPRKKLPGKTQGKRSRENRSRVRQWLRERTITP
jgi:hypothetical protein